MSRFERLNNKGATLPLSALHLARKLRAGRETHPAPQTKQLP